MQMWWPGFFFKRPVGLRITPLGKACAGAVQALFACLPAGHDPGGNGPCPNLLIRFMTAPR
jgi:hypothetical protein